MEAVQEHTAGGQPYFVIEFNGHRFIRRPNSKHPNYFFRKYKKGGVWYCERLHQEIYKLHHGTLPEGCVIHHIDENPLNNDISNLQAVTASQHQEIHKSLDAFNKSKGTEHIAKIGFTRVNWQGRRSKVLQSLSDERRKCDHCNAEFIPTNTHQRFCGKKCHHKWQYTATELNVELLCQSCGKPFQGNKYLKPKSCSKTCANNLSIIGRRRNIARS